MQRLLPSAAVAALAAGTVAGCGVAAHPPAPAPGTSQAVGASLGRGRVDDPRAKHIACLRATGQPVTMSGQTDETVGTGSAQIRIHYEATAGSAQSEQIQGHEPASEVIGSALVYPGSAADQQLGPVEDCLAQGVQG